jgi:rSAM/selenodomain-associated transferase 2
VKPELSIVIPVYHEEDEIAPCIRRIERLGDSETLEIIVSDGACGSTVEHLPPTSIPTKTVISPAGRGTQIKEGCAAASAPAILVLHVDTKLPKSAPAAVHKALNHHAAGAFDLEIESDNPLVRLIGIVGRARSRITRVPYGDQVHFFRRSLLRSIGGYPSPPIMEDVAFMDELKRRGIKITILGLKARTSDRRWTKEGAVFATARNWVLYGAYRLGADPHRLLRWYRAHTA